MTPIPEKPSGQLQEALHRSRKSHSIYHLQLTPEGIMFQIGIMQAYKELSGDYNIKTPLEEKLDNYVRTDLSTNPQSVLPHVL